MEFTSDAVADFRENHKTQFLAGQWLDLLAKRNSALELGADPEMAEMLRIVRANGWDRNLTAQQQFKWRKQFDINSEFEAKYTFYDLAFNMRPTEITGFLGQYQMQFLEENINCREKSRRTTANNDNIVIMVHILSGKSVMIPFTSKVFIFWMSSGSLTVHGKI